MINKLKKLYNFLLIKSNNKYINAVWGIFSLCLIFAVLPLAIFLIFCLNIYESIRKDTFVWIFWLAILSPCAYYYLSDTHKINEKYACNFDVFFPNWEEHGQDLLKKRKKLIDAKDDPGLTGFFLKNQIEDAYKDIQKKGYLKESEIRQAQEIIDRYEYIKKRIESGTEENHIRVNACLDYVAKKTNKNYKPYYGIGNEKLCKFPDGLEFSYIKEVNDYQKEKIANALTDLVDLKKGYSVFSYDLNNDGYNEVFVSKIPGHCGSGGCADYIIDGKTNKIILEDFFYNIKIAKTISNNYFQIIKINRNYENSEVKCDFNIYICSMDKNKYICE